VPVFYLAVSGLFLLAFAISFAQEQRRLRNGVLLLIGLLVLGLGLLFQYLDRPGVDTSVASELIAVLVLGALFVVLPVFLVANGVLMLRREGRRLGNMLSLLAGLGIVVFLGLTLLTGTGDLPDWLDDAVFALGVVLVYLALVFAAYVGYSVVYARVPRHARVDFVVVHGSRLLGSRVPPLLASRLDRARAVVEREDAAGGHPMIITSGGRGSDEETTEAAAMASYLIAAGVPAERILLEDRSTTTRENLVNSRELMIARDPGYRCLLVTNNFHAFRTALIAREVHVNGQVVGAPTAWYYLPSATIREFVGILRDHWLVNVLLIGALLVAALWPW
jgi:uncharacterized SAM-binding protein YcdF (DUF218 family)